MTINGDFRRSSASGLLSVVGMAMIFSLFFGCTEVVQRIETTKSDEPFAAETYDEYTEPLTNVIIGTPSGTTRGPSADAWSGLAEHPFALSLADSADPEANGFAFWHFDDCSASSHFLIDSSGGGANAQQELGASCVPGIAGQGVQIRNQKDVVQVPDEPQFTVSSRIALAAWVHPNAVDGHHPIVIKRLQNQTAFSLGIHDGNIEMSVVLTSGTTVISRAPIAPGVWTHVAGMFDGTFVFLFINGQQFGQVYGAGTLRNVYVPLRIGATTQTQYFDGEIDDVFVSTQAISKDDLSGLSCVRRPSTLTVSPVAATPVPFDTVARYDVTVVNNDAGTCLASDYNMFFNFFEPGINVVVDSRGSSQNAPPGGTVTFGVEVTGSEDATVGPRDIAFTVFRFGATFEQLDGHLAFELVAPSCFVSKRKELMITATSVVDDPVRASASSTSPNSGVWTFGHLMRDIAPTPEDAPAMTEQLFQTWLTNQTVNGFIVEARPAMQPTVLDVWPRTASGALDLDRAPFTLQAIVNRLDLRDVATGSAGQGRFVFSLNNFFGSFGLTVIVEYNLPARNAEEVLEWANLWHGLSSLSFPSAAYNQALETITRRFSSRNASPGSVNGSALVSLRTNENILSPFNRWELRQFELSPEGGLLQQTTVTETPDVRFNGTQAFADFVNQNEAAIIAELPGAVASTTVPLQFQGTSFRAGSAFNDFFQWSGAGITNPEARFHASNTCNGCHGPETGTQFLQIFPRFPGSEASLAGFLTGTVVFDPFTGQSRTFNDLQRRKDDLTSLVCPPPSGEPSHARLLRASRSRTTGH